MGTWTVDNSVHVPHKGYMRIIDALLLVSDAYCASTGIAEATLSSRVFNDGKRIAAVRGGKDIGARRVERAMIWFSGNWPAGAIWPAAVPRPVLVLEAAE